MRLNIVIRIVLAGAAAAAIAAPVPVHAQFGGLLKKAKAKVAGGSDSAAAANGGSGSSAELRAGAPKFDATVVELTPSVVDEMLRGMTAEARVAQASDAREAKLDADLAALEKEVDQLHAQHPSSERDAWQDSNNRIDECIGDELEKRAEQNEGAMQARLMSDPAVRQKMIELSQRATKETQAGDTAAARKTMAEVQALTHPTAGADSAAAIAKCGKPAPRPAWMVHDEELSERRTKITAELRASASAARDTALLVVAKGHGGGGGGAGGGGVGGAGLTAPQYSMALERMVAWAAMTAPGGKVNSRLSYSSVELDALKARDADVRRLTGELRAHNVYR